MPRAQFHECPNLRFCDSVFAGKDVIPRLEGIAWLALKEGRKAPNTRYIGPGLPP